MLLAATRSSDLRNAGVRHDRDGAGEETAIPSWLELQLIARSLYVAFTMFVGICIPFFGGLLGFFGGFAFAPTTYFLPCFMWLAIYKPKRFSLSWMANWVCIILRVMLMIASPIGGLRQIIMQSKDVLLLSEGYKYIRISIQKFVCLFAYCARVCLRAYVCVIMQKKGRLFFDK